MFSRGIVKLVSENENNFKIQINILSTALLFQFILSITIGSLIILFSEEISIILFDTINQKKYLVFYGLLVFTFSLNQAILGYLNGKKNILKFVKLEVVNNAIIILTAILLVYLKGFNGYLLAFAFSGSILLTINLFYISPVFENFKFHIDKKILNRLFSFSIIVIISAIFGPMFKIFIRRIILNENGLTYSGYWDSLNKLSSIYMLFILYPISKFFMPKISSIKDKLIQLKHLKKTLLTCGIITLIFLCFFKYFSREIILISFSEDFSKANNFVNFQIAGDFFRVFCIIISNFFIGIGKLKYFLIIELFGYFNYFLFFRIFSFLNLQDSIFASYLIMNLLSLILCFFITKSFIKNNYGN